VFTVKWHLHWWQFSWIKTTWYLLVDEIDYSRTQAPLDVVRHRRMAPASMTIQLHQNHVLLARKRNRIFSDTGAFICKRKHRRRWQFSLIKIVCYLLAVIREYSQAQAPLVVVHRQMAPESVTTQSHQNHIVFTSRWNRIFLDAGTSPQPVHRIWYTFDYTKLV
jgi:hypothetical protein